MKTWMKNALVIVAATALFSAAAQAQTDVALSGFPTFTSSTTGSGTVQTPKNAGGGLLEVRHIFNPLAGYDISYSFNIADEAFAASNGGSYPVSGTLEVSGKTNQVAANWIVSKAFHNLQPFALGGAGFDFTTPGASPKVQASNGLVNVSAVNTVVRPVFIYGGGLDYTFARRLGVRLQYRGNITKAPQLLDIFNSTTKYTTISEPMAGVFYRF